MTELLTLLCFLLILTVIVVVHEGGHALAARLLGARVTEFFVGMPFGPSVSRTSSRTGITYGATLALLGGYTRIAGMAPAEHKELSLVLALVNARGWVKVSEVARVLNCPADYAQGLLDQLVDWGSVVREGHGGAHGSLSRRGAPASGKEHAAYATPERDAEGRTSHDRGFDRGALACRQGEPYRPAVSADEFFAAEHRRTFQGLSVPARLVVLVAGVACNLLFAVVLLTVYCMACGVYASDGTLVHLDLATSLLVAVTYLVDVAVSVLSLLDPAQTAEVLSDSAGVVGVAAITYAAVEQGPGPVILLAAMLSVSLGWMNLLPIPPLDGGKVLIELVQLVIRRPLSLGVQNALSLVGIFLFTCLFFYMVFQDASNLGVTF